MGDAVDRATRYRQLGLHTDARIGWLLDRAADRWPDREAIVFEQERITYRELWRWTTAVADDLVANGVKPADSVLWQLPNSLEAVVLHLATWRIGAVSVPVVPLYREHEMAQILRQVKPTVVAFVARQRQRRPAEEMAGLMAGIGIDSPVRIAVGGQLEGWLNIRVRAEVGDVDEADLPDPMPADDCCLVLFTSGTTAAPKGVMHSSNSLLAQASIYTRTYGLTYRDTVVMGAPITHIGGLYSAVVSPISVGGRSVLMPAWDPDQAVALVERERATICSGAAVFLQAFVERYERGESPAHRVPAFLCGGAAIPPSLIERAEAVGIRAFRAWGMSECPAATLGAIEDPLELRSRRDGRTVEATEVEAVDDARCPLPPGQMGELRLRSPEMMLGYTDAAANAAQVDVDGWFYTGDVGMVDDAGWITVTGRIKDIINRGGEKFSAQDIEAAIVAHPAIALAAVVGVPCERFGEKVAAFVVLRQGAGWPGRQSLLDHLETMRMARQKFPVVWRVLDALPMTMSGKTKKNELLGQWNAGLVGAPEPD
jgi:acyl-CoA synthetase (AMP-forming)/AMP-acid ligase II